MARTRKGKGTHNRGKARKRNKEKKTSKRTYETDRQNRSERARTDSYYIIHTDRNQVRSNIVRLKEREREIRSEGMVRNCEITLGDPGKTIPRAPRF